MIMWVKKICDYNKVPCKRTRHIQILLQSEASLRLLSKQQNYSSERSGIFFISPLPFRRILPSWEKIAPCRRDLSLALWNPLCLPEQTACSPSRRTVPYFSILCLDLERSYQCRIKCYVVFITSLAFSPGSSKG